MAVWISAALLTALVGEPIMTVIHQKMFHGPLWFLHRSHHEHPGVRHFVTNDGIWVVYLAITAMLVALGVLMRSSTGAMALSGAAAGAFVYGLGYIFAHDGVAHKRFPVPAFIKESALFRGLTKAHHLHHRSPESKPGYAPFGVYSAPLELKSLNKEKVSHEPIKARFCLCRR